jgi:hypothetical protein
MKYQNIKLEKGMYSLGNKSFLTVLEELDPSENYKGSDLEGTDAYERQMKRFGIREKGDKCSKIGKFFENSDSKVLLPEFIRRKVKEGMELLADLSYIIAAKTVIEANDYRPIKSVTRPVVTSGTANADSSGSSGTETQDINLQAISPGEDLRIVDISSETTVINLIKYGRLLSAPYETAKNQNLEVFSVFLKRIGYDIASEMISNAVSVISQEITMIDVSDSAKGVLAYKPLPS